MFQIGKIGTTLEIRTITKVAQSAYIDDFRLARQDRKDLRARTSKIIYAEREKDGCVRLVKTVNLRTTEGSAKAGRLWAPWPVSEDVRL